MTDGAVTAKGQTDRTPWMAAIEMRPSAQERLLEAYRHQPRIEPCACGGQIVAGASDAEIRAAVTAHYRTPRHAEYRGRNEAALHQAELGLHLFGEPVPEEMLLRGRRCPCGGHR